MAIEHANEGISAIEDLFACLAEQIKSPILQASTAAQAMDTTDAVTANSQLAIVEASQSALRLLDGFLLSLKLQRDGKLELEPVSVSSLLYDVSQSLYQYAKLNNCRLEMDIAGRSGPVMSHQRALKFALINLGYSFISASNSSGGKTIKLVAKQTGKGVTAGVFAESKSLSKVLFDRAKIIKGFAHQPIAEFSNDNAAGVFVADSLLNNIGSKMRVSKRNGAAGLAVDLLPSYQLSLV